MIMLNLLQQQQKDSVYYFTNSSINSNNKIQKKVFNHKSLLSFFLDYGIIDSFIRLLINYY